MSPTESSYPTKLRGISVDFREVSPRLEEQDLGAISSEALIELLEKFGAIDPVKLVDSDPEILIIGRRGRYVVRNSHKKLTLRPAGDPIAAFIELSPEKIPFWMDQTDESLWPDEEEKERDDTALILEAKSSSRHYIVTMLMIASLCTLGVSIFFSFQPVPIDDQDHYQTIENPSTLASLQQQALGRYANVDGSVEILVENTDRLVLIETDGPHNSLKEESTHPYTLMTGPTGDPVLFSHDIGVLNLSGKATLNYNGDTYHRTY